MTDPNRLARARRIVAAVHPQTAASVRGDAVRFGMAHNLGRAPVTYSPAEFDQATDAAITADLRAAWGFA